MRAAMRIGRAIRPYQTIFNTYYLQVTMHTIVEYRQALTSRKIYMHDIKHIVSWTADRGLTLQSLSHDDLVGFHSRLECTSDSSPCSSAMELISPSFKMPQSIKMLKQFDDTR